jgi:DNA invertase Pin-like site-specific DNA recombinase
MTKKPNAVLYLRSSKDRHDVSIEAQRHELAKLAADRGYAVVGEFRDVVESGKDDDRPGFQDLIEAAGRRDRGWQVIIVLDTSRIARRLAAAVKFEEDVCRQKGVTVVYKSIPESEDAERALIKAVLHGVDEWHSLVSRRKAIAGMRQNVRRGFRAGGRAPIGYKLDYVDTGAMREGKPVLKSRLVPSSDAQLVQRYLKERAAGAARVPLARRLGLTLNDSSLVGIEWNALTYAGHTVWYVHAEPGAGTKRRPRAEWVVQRDTHEALITDSEAEALVSRLEEASAARPRRTAADYLLTGLLRTSAGVPWYGERSRYYRAGNAYLPARDVDEAIMGRIAQDLRSQAFSAALVRRVRSSYGREFDAEIERLRASEAALVGRISRFMEMAEKNDVAEPALRKVAELERDRKRIEREIAQARRDAATAAAARAVTEDQVAGLLDALATDMQRFDREKLKDFLLATVERVTLNAETLSARIHYKIPLTRRDRMASPRTAEAVPHGKITSYVRIRRAA